MTRAVQRQLTLATLRGHATPRTTLLQAGLAALVGVRRANQIAIASALKMRSSRSTYVEFRTARNHKVKLWLGQCPEPNAPSDLVLSCDRWTRGRRRTRRTQAVPQAAELIMDRLKPGDDEDLMVALRAIDRARIRCFELAEEGSRWLPQG